MLYDPVCDHLKVSTFFNCSYWLNPRIAERLKKGTLVELFGRAGVNVYNDMKGEAKGSLIFHVNNIKIHQATKAETASTVPAAESISEPGDDLPF
jgi:single-strand DNA-binding protein